tara:strand:- start:597 stop:2171 length:1575 start_codon:yes stop_codon:yes gene_type:complete
MSNNITTSYATPENTSIAGLRTLISTTIYDNMFSDNQIFFFITKEFVQAGVSPDSLQSAETIYENIVMLDRVTPEETSSVVPRIDWEKGTVYNGFDSTRNMYNYQVGFSGNVNLEYKTYVMTDEYNVYLCIKNSESGFIRSKVGSTIKPTSVDTEEFTLADGYTWKYMYSLNNADFAFLTQKFLPVPAPVKINETIINKTSAKYRQQQNQLTAVGGSIRDLRVNLSDNRNVYFDVSNPRVEVVGMGTDGKIELKTTFVAGKGYKLTGYAITNKGKDYIGGGVRLIDSPNGNGDFVTSSSVENLLTIETSYGGVEKDISSDPRVTLQARTIMILGNISQTNESIGSLPNGITCSGFGLIANPVYGEGSSYAGKVAGAEFGYGTNTRLNIRQTPIVKIKDNSGTGFAFSTAQKINDNRLLPNSKITIEGGEFEYQGNTTSSTVMDLRPNQFSGAGTSNVANLYITGSKRPFTTSDIIKSGTNATFEVESVIAPTLKVGSGDLLYINKTTFNVLESQVFKCSITLVQ